MSQQIVIDSLAFAREKGSLQGELQVASLSRVLDALAESAGSLAYRVEGRKSARDRAQLLLQVSGVLLLQCQRCLDGIEFKVEINSLLELVEDESDLTQEELEDDSRDFLPAQKEFDVVALIEDEVILALPSAPRHESCATPEAGCGGAKPSPFAVLAGLKGKA